MSEKIWSKNSKNQTSNSRTGNARENTYGWRDFLPSEIEKGSTIIGKEEAESGLSFQLSQII